MVDVSKLARARLATTPAAGPHPDADLLTAFAERVVSPAEREQVLAHLATCADCREVVALAVPAAPVEQPVAVVTPAKPKWLPWPVLRWGAVTAAVAIVAVVVFLESPKYQPQPVSTEMAKVKVAKPQPEASFVAGPATTKQANAATAPQQASAAARAGKEKDTLAASRENYEFSMKKEQSATPNLDKLTAAAPAPPPAPATAEIATAKRAEPQTRPGAAGGMVRSAPVMTERKVEDEAAAVASKPATQPPAEDAAKVAANEPAGTLAKQRSTRSDTTTAYRSEGYVGAQSSAPGAGAAINGMRDANEEARLRTVTFKWVVTSDGRVQRSADGRTWLYVAIDPKARIRALVTDGDEVWAGGERGVLYHSADAGDNWSKVALDRVNGDIIRLVINGSTLIISTSAGQTISMSHEGLSESPAKPNSPR